jgi:hypothetical protein
MSGILNLKSTDVAVGTGFRSGDVSLSSGNYDASSATDADGSDSERHYMLGSSGNVAIKSGSVDDGEMAGNVTVSPGILSVPQGRGSTAIGGILSLTGGDVLEYKSAFYDSMGSTSGSAEPIEVNASFLVGGGVEIQAGESPHTGGALFLRGGFGHRTEGGSVHIEAGNGANSGSLLFQIPDNPGTYVKGSKGLAGCPEGYEVVTSVEECAAASLVLGLTYSEVGNGKIGAVNSVCNLCEGYPCPSNKFGCPCDLVVTRVSDNYGPNANWICRGGFTGIGGSVQIQTGAAMEAGHILFSVGDSTEDGGAVSLESGTSLNGDGGTIQLRSGSSSRKSGGDIVLLTGDANVVNATTEEGEGSSDYLPATSGNVSVRTGAASMGRSGGINLVVGIGEEGGDVNILAGTGRRVSTVSNDAVTKQKAPPLEESHAQTTFQGGSINIQSGESSPRGRVGSSESEGGSICVGGALHFTSPLQNDTCASGNIDIHTGISTGGASGPIHITTGSANTKAGNVTISSGSSQGDLGACVAVEAGDANAADGQGGSISVRGGSGNLKGGAIFISGGASNASSDGTGGNVWIGSGSGLQTSGNISIHSESSFSNGSAGDVLVYGGKAVDKAGRVLISGGSSEWNAGANVEICSGGSRQNVSGAVVIRSEASLASEEEEGGKQDHTSAKSERDSGPLIFQSGDSAEGSSGSIRIEVGSSLLPGGNVLFSAGNSHRRDGGDIKIEAGGSNATNHTSGSIFLSTPSVGSHQSQSSGGIFLESGSGQHTSGDVVLQSGNSTVGVAGGVSLYAGSNTDIGGRGGRLKLQAGMSVGASGGDVAIQSGGLVNSTQALPASSGRVQISSSNVASNQCAVDAIATPLKNVPKKTNQKNLAPAEVRTWSNASTGDVWLQSGDAWGANSGHLVFQSGVSGTVTDGGGKQCEGVEGRGYSGNVLIKGGNSAFGYGGNIVLRSGKLIPQDEKEGRRAMIREATLVLNGGKHINATFEGPTFEHLGNVGDIVLRPGTSDVESESERSTEGAPPPKGGAFLVLDRFNDTRFEANDTMTMVNMPEDGGVLLFLSSEDLRADAGSNMSLHAVSHMALSSDRDIGLSSGQSQFYLGRQNNGHDIIELKTEGVLRALGQRCVHVEAGTESFAAADAEMQDASDESAKTNICAVSPGIVMKSEDGISFLSNTGILLDASTSESAHVIVHTHQLGKMGIGPFFAPQIMPPRAFSGDVNKKKLLTSNKKLLNSKPKAATQVRKYN